MPCSLTRGNYNRAWNEVVLGESSGVRHQHYSSNDRSSSIKKTRKSTYSFENDSVKQIHQSLQELEQIYLKPDVRFNQCVGRLQIRSAFFAFQLN